MKGFLQEVVRVVLLDVQRRCITKVDISKGTVNESLAHPREIFRPAITHSAYGFVLVHNHSSGVASPSEIIKIDVTRKICSNSLPLLASAPGTGRRPTQPPWHAGNISKAFRDLSMHEQTFNRQMRWNFGDSRGTSPSSGSALKRWMISLKRQ